MDGLGAVFEKKINELVDLKIKEYDSILSTDEIKELISETVLNITTKDVTKILEAVMPDLNKMISKEVQKHLSFLGKRFGDFITESFKKMKESEDADTT